MSCNELLEKIDSCTVAKKDFFEHYWYNFYNNAFSELVTAHAALFGGLIAVAVAVFGIKYWLDNHDIDNKIKYKVEKKATEIEEEYKQKLIDLQKIINHLEQKSSGISTQSYKLYLKILTTSRNSKINCSMILDVIKEMLESSSDEIKRVMFAEIIVLFEDIKKVLKKENVDEEHRKVAKQIKELLLNMKEKKAKQTELVKFDDYISFFDDLSGV